MNLGYLLNTGYSPLVRGLNCSMCRLGWTSSGVASIRWYASFTTCLTSTAFRWWKKYWQQTHDYNTGAFRSQLHGSWKTNLIKRFLHHLPRWKKYWQQTHDYNTGAFRSQLYGSWKTNLIKRFLHHLPRWKKYWQQTHDYNTGAFRSQVYGSWKTNFIKWLQTTQSFKLVSTPFSIIAKLLLIYIIKTKSPE